MARRKTKTTHKQRAQPGALRLITPPRQREILGAGLVALGLITLLAFVSQGGSLTRWWLGVLELAMGRGAVLAPLVLGGLGAWLFGEAVEGRERLRWERPIGGVACLAAVLGLGHFISTAVSDGRSMRMLAESNEGGGWLGYAVATAFTVNLGTVPGVVALVAVAVVAATLMVGLTLRDTAALTGRAGRSALRGLWARRPQRGRPRERASRRPGPSPEPADPDGGVVAQAARARMSQAGSPHGAPVVRVRDPSRLQWNLPELEEVLDPPVDIAGSSEEAQAVARLIEDTLAEFGVPVRVVEINHGPTITQYGLEPGYIERGEKRSKVKVSRIVALQNDLALALAASPIRIQAPVPGQPFVGVEVPNAASSLVSLRGVLESEAFARVAERGALPIALGRDTSGLAVAADLQAMPHLLIAGATGSGKSVAINAVISALIVGHTPDTLKLLLIDPKRVELATFRGLPHLAAPVVVDLERVVGVLQWAVREMDQRYRTFAETSVRNIHGYNRQMIERGSDLMPFIVIVVDELADLMLTVPEEAERLITRLAQLARATGIHLVIATQRPSVDVVTGLIKANFPARIAFAVSSSVDSRVILDTAGADKLLGRGDMLYQASDSSKLRRLQGCFVSDSEIERLTRVWKRQARPSRPAAETSLTLGIPEPLIQPELWEKMGEAKGRPFGEERDALWDDTVALIRQHSTASTSFLQRKLRIGYSRAARLMDELEEEGLVGPAQGNQPRQVLIGPDDLLEEAARAEGRAPHSGDEMSEEDDDEGIIRPWLSS